jgi:hypothetical protein
MSRRGLAGLFRPLLLALSLSHVLVMQAAGASGPSNPVSRA